MRVTFRPVSFFSRSYVFALDGSNVRVGFDNGCFHWLSGDDVYRVENFGELMYRNEVEVGRITFGLPTWEVRSLDKCMSYHFHDCGRTTLELDGRRIAVGLSIGSNFSTRYLMSRRWKSQIATIVFVDLAVRFYEYRKS